MCGILVHPVYLNNDNRFKFHLGQNRGIQRKQILSGHYVFNFDHLPIQTDISNNPFVEHDGWIILFNGEIFQYNHREYESDTEFIRSFVKNVKIREMVPWELFHCLIKKDGFFVIVMFDQKTENFYFFTDPMAKKPLYINKKHKIISSEVRSCLNYSEGLLEIDFTVNEILSKGFSDIVPYKDVEKLHPGVLYLYEKDVFIPICYKGYTELYKNLWKGESLQKLLQDSVDNRLRKLNEITLFYSGGLDSSIINFHIENSEFKPKNIQKLTIELDENSSNLVDVEKIQSDGISSRNAAILAMELPFDLGSLAYQYDLFKNSKHTVVLTGDGADELFGGYSRTLKEDTQKEDIFELMYFHNLKLDKMSSAFTKECRSPFQSPMIISYALNLPYEKRKLKTELYEYGKSIGVNCPKKTPMKVNSAEDKTNFRIETLDIWSQLILRRK